MGSGEEILGLRNLWGSSKRAAILGGGGGGGVLENCFVVVVVVAACLFVLGEGRKRGKLSRSCY